MKVNFQNICGHLITLELPSDSIVLYACKLLSQKLETTESQILFVSPNENQNYYPLNESMENVIKENPEYVVYIKYNQINQNKSETISISPKKGYSLFTSRYSSLKKIPIKYLILLNKIKWWNKLNQNSLYIEYSECIQNIPDDFQQKIDEISVLGFEIEDIKEALRNSDYNVLFAINSLVYRNSDERIQDQPKISQRQAFRFSINYNKLNLA